MAPLWQTSDARLVARVKKGDQQAFEQLYARYQPSVLSFARHLTGQLEDAEDAVQHAFLATYQRIAESEEALDVRPWLFAVARNRCLSLLRARGAQGTATPVEKTISTDGLAAEVERRQELRDLVGDLGRLPEPQRAALLLSQLDALSHSQVATVLGVAPEKVKALVFQARSSLAATRDAREAPCSDIQTELATSRGSALRRRTLRRHVHECTGCREFEIAVQRQRHELDSLLPVLPTLGLREAVLGGVAGRGGAAAGTATDLVTAGGTGGGLVVSLLGIGAQGAAKLALVGVIAGGTTAGAVAADLPARIEHTVGRQAPNAQELSQAPGGAGDRGAPLSRGGEGSDPDPPQARRHDAQPRGSSPERHEPGVRAERPEAEAGSDPDSGAPSGGGESEDETDGSDSGHDGLPPGLAKRDELPPGLAKKDELPPGLAKQKGAPPGKSKGAKEPPGQAKQPPGSPAGGGGQDNGNGGANGNGGGNGDGNGNGNGNGNGGESAQGNGGGGGGGNGNGGSNGNGNGKKP
jgi:RNA polymerase sigma factor (sigma-70 family)